MDWTPEQRTKALMLLAENHGDVKLVGGMLVDDEFLVPEDTLRFWMLEEHREQYKRIEAERGRRLEAETIALLQETIRQTAQLKRELAEDVAKITDQRYLPNALRAIADTESRAVNGLLQLTGRPVNGAQSGSTDAMLKLATTLVEQGLLKPADGVSLEAPLPVLNEAEVAPHES